MTLLLAASLVVTNLAGNAVSVDPAKLVYPMSIFPASEQARIRAARGEKAKPTPKAKRIDDIYDRELKRAEARHQSGRMTDEELAKKRAAIAAAREMVRKKVRSKSEE